MNCFKKLFQFSFWKKNVRANKICCVIKIQLFFYFAFVMIDYKVQNFTLTDETLNLFYVQSKTKKRFEKNMTMMKKHKKFCSIYVQFSRFKNFENLRLINAMFLHDIQNRFHFLFLRKNQKLKKFNNKTIVKWIQYLKLESFDHR